MKSLWARKTRRVFYFEKSLRMKTLYFNFEMICVD